jgi:hypothetical protein
MSNYVIDRYVAGLLPAEEQRAVEARCATDRGFLSRVQAAQALRREFLATHPPARALETLSARPKPSYMWWSLAVAPAFVLLLLVWPRTAPPSDAPAFTAKGSADPVSVHVFSKDGTAKNADAFAPGDVIRFSVAKPGLVGVFGKDETQTGRLLFATHADGPADLPLTLTVDDSPADEMLYVVLIHFPAITVVPVLVTKALPTSVQPIVNQP